MSVRRTGDWAKARRMLSGASVRVQRAMDQSVRQEAEGLRKEIVQGLTRQAPGGEKLKPPSPLTIAARKLRGSSSSKALIDRGDLLGAITVTMRGGQAFVGVSRKARGRDGQPLVNVANAHEFGAGPFTVPMTPKMRRFLFMLLRRAGVAPRGGGGSGVVVIKIPARPFLRPAFKKFSSGVQKRIARRVLRLMGWG